MGKPLKYTTFLILACVLCFLYVMNRESFLTTRENFELFSSYIKRASDPHEKQLRLAEWKQEAAKGTRANRTETTLKFVDETYYLHPFSKTYKLVLIRKTGMDDADDWIDAGLFLTIDYGVFDRQEVIYWLSRVSKSDSYWNALYSLYDHPVHSVRKKILGEEIF